MHQTDASQQPRRVACVIYTQRAEMMRMLAAFVLAMPAAVQGRIVQNFDFGWKFSLVRT
jgi:hypothetical protein